MGRYDLYFYIASAGVNFPMVGVHYFYIRLFEEEHRDGFCRIFFYVLLGAVNTVWFVCSREMYFYAFTAVLYVVYAAYSRIFFRYPWKESVFYTMLYYFLTHFVVRTACWVGMRAAGYDFMSYGVELAPALIGVSVISLTSFAVVWLFRRRLRLMAGYRLSGKEFLNILLLGIPLLYFCHSQSLMTVDFLHLPAEMVCVRIAVSLSAVYALAGVVSMNRSREEQVEIERIRGLLTSQYEQFRLKKESSERIMAKCHDLQKQLRLFEDTRRPEYIEEYSRELQKTIHDFDSLYETGNATIDTLLSEASLKCREDGVQIICLLDGRSFDGVDPMDLCTIFGNALDNAIESARRIESREKRLIHVKSREEKGFLLLRFDNYYEHELLWENGELTTTKEEMEWHGYGLKSIRFAVEKYQGRMESRTENGRFVLTILFPMESLREVS